MSNWKRIFETAFRDFEGVDELEMEFSFYAPASIVDIRGIEDSKGVKLTEELKGIFLEFNGISVKEKYWGRKNLYLPISEVIEDVEDYIKNSGNPTPPETELNSVVFFAQQNGYAVLYGMCCQPFGEFKVGQVLALDHETGEFEVESENLEEFVGNSWHCGLS
ncbi:SMI1/KNR4 family protein [Microbulbifer halophilus]|uniref:SMI1/KNR4 family protein n=1 Tax=Microbulbifer halophilus TaxID=453963 RepID=A0ABW5EJJ6_9GAMM|nr:SMI1/KNR4 family protein [Microbulbifer halophilus]MCW8128683.1 SMI1/KNR4 family protein [Microbulbifer halophilus]